MHTFAQKPKTTQQTTSAKSPILRRAHFCQNREVSSVLHLQRTIGNQAVRGLLEANTRDVKGDSTTEIARFGHDFSRISIHSPTAEKIQTKLPINKPGDYYEQEADSIADQVMRMSEQFQQFFDGKPKGGEKKPAPEKPPSREPCDKKCGTSGGPYGNTECEIDRESGLPTGKVTKEVFDKNPCTRPCVEVHEGVHTKMIAPICTATRKCLDAADGDIKKQDKCLDQFDAEMNALTFSTECAAYTAEEGCLSNRTRKAECRSADDKKRWDEQMKMVKCYKECFCKA